MVSVIVTFMLSKDLKEINSICNSLWLNSEKAMAPHSSTLAWKIPWTEAHGEIQIMGSQESDQTQ